MAQSFTLLYSWRKIRLKLLILCVFLFFYWWTPLACKNPCVILYDSLHLFSLENSQHPSLLEDWLIWITLWLVQTKQNKQQKTKCLSDRLSQFKTQWDLNQQNHFYMAKYETLKQFFPPKHCLEGINLFCIWMWFLSVRALSLTMTDSQPESNHSPWLVIGERRQFESHSLR